MKQNWSLLVTLLLPSLLMAQRPDPVHWNYSVQKTATDSLQVHMTATIEEGWHVYAQIQPEDAIAIPTKVVFAKNPLVILSGKTKETGTKEIYEDKTAGIVQYQYGGKVDFIQSIVLKVKVKTNITGSITYQACTGEMCLPPKTIAFTITLDN